MAFLPGISVVCQDATIVLPVLSLPKKIKNSEGSDSLGRRGALCGLVISTEISQFYGRTTSFINFYFFELAIDSF